MPVKRSSRYFGRCVALVVLVLLFGVGSEVVRLSPSVVATAGEAGMECDAAVHEPLESGCSAAVWRACEKALEYWLDARSDSWLSWRQDDIYRFMPQWLLCRAAHMAELAELAAVLADKYGSE